MSELQISINYQCQCGEEGAFLTQLVILLAVADEIPREVSVYFREC